MNRMYSLFPLLLILSGSHLSANPGDTGNPLPGPEISLAAWKDGKAAAFVIFSDDSMVRSIKSRWTLENPEVPYDGFYTLGKTYNIPVTFFVIPRLMDDTARGETTHTYFSSLRPPAINAGAGGSWADWQFMHAQGHEIASHTYSHTDYRPDAEGKPTSSLDPHVELSKAVEAIAKHIGEKPLSMNFPYGSPAVEALAIARHYTPLMDEDFSGDTANVRKAVYGSETLAEELIAEMQQALDAGQCLIIGGHGIRTDLGRKEEAAADFEENGTRWDGYMPVEYAVLDSLFQYLDQHRGQIYIDAFKNVSRYLAERKASRLRILEQTEGMILVELSHDLDPEVYNVPLTLRIMPQAVGPDIRVTQDGVTVPVAFQNEVFLAEVTPNGGPIQITSRP